MRRTAIIEIEECPYCKYQWIPRVKSPMACPRCKRYLIHTEEVKPEASL